MTESGQVNGSVESYIVNDYELIQPIDSTSYVCNFNSPSKWVPPPNDAFSTPVTVTSIPIQNAIAMTLNSSPNSVLNSASLDSHRKLGSNTRDNNTEQLEVEPMEINPFDAYCASPNPDVTTDPIEQSLDDEAFLQSASFYQRFPIRRDKEQNQIRVDSSVKHEVKNFKEGFVLPSPTAQPNNVSTYPFDTNNSAPEFKSDDHLISHYSEVASHHLSLGQYTLAMKQFQCILAHARDIVENSPKKTEQLRFQNIIADTLNNIGVMHEMKGEYLYGLQACKEALRLYRQIGSAYEKHDGSNKDSEAMNEHWQQNVTRTSCNIAQMITAQKSHKDRMRLHQTAYDLFVEGKAEIQNRYRIEQYYVINEPNNNSKGGSNLSASASKHSHLVQSISYFIKVMNNEKTTLGKTHPQVGRTMMCLSHVYCSLEQFDEAFRYIHMAVAILKNGLGESHPNVATAYAALGRIHYTMGEYDDAIQWLKLAGGIQRTALVHEKPGSTGEGFIDFVEGTNCPASLSTASALAATEDEVVMTHEAIASTWISMGVVYMAKRELNKALECHREALSIFLEIEEKTTREDGKNYYHRKYKKQRKEAASRSESEIDVQGQPCRKAVQTDDLYRYPILLLDENGHTRDTHMPRIAVALAWLGEIHRIEGHQSRSLEAFERARIILTERLGPRHLSISTILVKLGMTYRMSGRYGKATQSIRDAMAIQSTHFGYFHDTLAWSLTELGEVYEQSGDTLKGLEIYKDALATQRKVLPSMHINHARLLLKIGKMKESMDQFDDAFIYYSEALRIYQRSDDEKLHSIQIEEMKIARDRLIGIRITLTGREGQMEPTRANGVNRIDKLAEWNMDKGSFYEALRLYHESLELKRQSLGEEHINVGLALQHIARVKEKQNCFDEAHILCAECLRIYRVNGLTFQHHLVKDVLKLVKIMDSGST